MKEIKDQVKDLFVEFIEDNCDPIDTYESYDSMLDDCTDTSNLPSYYDSPSEMMKKNDPIMYRCGYNDYLDSRWDEWVEINGEYYDNEDIEDARFDFHSELSDMLEGLVTGIKII